MKKLIYLFMLIIPLSAQEAKDDPFHASVGKETKKEVKQHDRQSWEGKRGMERRMMEKRKEMRKKQQRIHAIRLVVVGGLAYYIGYHQGEEHFNGGWDRRKDWSDRK